MTDSCDAYIALCLLDRGQGRDARITAIKIQRCDKRCYTTNSPNTAICWELHHSLSKTQFTQHKVLFIRNFVVSPTFRRWSIGYHLCVVRLPRSTNAAVPRISDWRLDVTLKTTENFVRIDKSEAEVTNNKRGILPYCWITDRLEASRGLSATAKLLVCCAMQNRSLSHCAVSVRPSVTFMYSIETTKHAIELVHLLHCGTKNAPTLADYNYDLV